MASQFEIAVKARFKCTYADCGLYFASEKSMKSHKRHSAEHDYCHKCDEDFDSFEDMAAHKAFTPDVHHMACRVCGEEFKSVSGLKRHIELSHKVDQKLTCIGCEETFNRASLLIEHLEFGKCPAISTDQFYAHIIHKQLITELLRETHDGDSNMDRFLQKQAKHDAAIDHDEEGGISLNIMDDNYYENARAVEYAAIEPEILQPTASELAASEQSLPFPPLPSQKASETTKSSHGRKSSVFDEIGERLERMSLAKSDSESVAVTSATTSVAGDFPPLSNAESSASTLVWGGNSARALFPKAASSVAPSDDFSVDQIDREREDEYGINIMCTRFWDPTNEGWSPERFFNPVDSTYFCPFPCEQHFKIPRDLALHIFKEHSIYGLRCPTCLKMFKSATALVAHCETRVSKCPINRTEDFATFLDRLTGGFLSVTTKIRPDHVHNPTVYVRDPETRRMEPYNAPQASYLQFSVTKPPDYKEPRKTIEIGCGREKGPRYHR